MSSRFRRRPRLPPTLEPLFKELQKLRQAQGLTAAKLATTHRLLALAAVRDEMGSVDINEVSALWRVLECAAKHYSGSDRAIIEMSLNFEQSPFLLTERRNALAPKLGRHVDTLREDEDTLLIGLITDLEASKTSPCRRFLFTPPPLPKLIGRARLVNRVHSVLRDKEAALVAIHGLPGVGKTAFARVLAARLAVDRVANVVHLNCKDQGFEELLFSLSLYLMSDRRAFYGTSVTQRIIAVKMAIGRKPLILLADDIHNAEVAQSVAGLVEEGVVIVVSRPRLRITEQHVPVEVKDLARGPAAMLLKRLVEPMKAPALGTLEFDEIFRHVGGNPFALQVAAVRLRSLGSAAGLAKRIKGEGVRLTTGAEKGSLAALLDENAKALTAEGRKALRALAAHPGGVASESSIGAVEQIRDVTSALEELSDFRFISDYDHATGWCSAPQIIKEYLQGRFRRSTSTRIRLSNYYAALARSAEKAMRTPSELAWLRELDRLAGNIDGLIDWSWEAGAVSHAVELSAHLHWYWVIRGDSKKRSLLITRMLDCGAAEGVELGHIARLHMANGWLHSNQSSFASAAQHFSSAAAIFASLGDRVHRDEAAVAEAYALWGANQFGESRRIAANVAMRATQDNARSVASAENVLGLCDSHDSPPDYGAAAGHFQAAADGREKLGDEWGAASSLGNLAEALRAGGAPAESARSLWTRILPVRREHGDRWAVANALNCIAELDASEGKLHKAMEEYCEAMLDMVAFENPLGVATSLTGAAAICASIDEHSLARDMLAMAAALLHTVGLGLGPAHRGKFAALAQLYAVTPDETDPAETFARSLELVERNRGRLSQLLKEKELSDSTSQ